MCSASTRAAPRPCAISRTSTARSSPRPARGRQPSGRRRARGREGPARRDGRGDRRPRHRAGGHLPRHRRRRSAGRLGRSSPASCGASARTRARSSSTTRSWRSRPARPARRASWSSRAPDRSAYGRNASNEGARVRRLGPRPRRRRQRLLDWPRRAARGAARGGSARAAHDADAAAAAALRRRRGAEPDPRGLPDNLQPAAIGSLARCVQAAFSEGDAVAIGILRGAADELESFGRQRGEAPRTWAGSRFRSSWRAASSAPCRGCATSCRGGCRLAVPEQHGAPARPRAGGRRRVARAQEARAARAFRGIKQT